MGRLDIQIPGLIIINGQQNNPQYRITISSYAGACPMILLHGKQPQLILFSKLTPTIQQITDWMF